MEDFFFFIFLFGLGLLLGWALASYFRRSQFQKEIMRFKEQLNEEKRRALLLEEMFKSSKDHFKGISVEALNESSNAFLKLASATFEKLYEKSQSEWEKRGLNELKPIRESLEKFNREINELEKTRIGAYSSLKEQVTSLLTAQKELKTETSNLVSALKSSQIRGRWGEIQLRRVVELAGMVPYCDFVEQKSEMGQEGRLRPDLIVQLPGNRKIVVDAKAPLSAYLEAFEMKEEMRRLKMKEHARLLRSHISLLGKKGYSEEFQPAPEFVVLFLPGDCFFNAALEEDPTLIEAGIESKVILATPTTLVALLKAVSYGWKQERLNKSAVEIVELGKELYKRLADMGAHFSKLGKSLEASVDAYNKTCGSMESRLLVTARRFKELESGGEMELENPEPVEKTARILQAPELIQNDSIRDAK